MAPDPLYRVALSLLPHVGPVTARKLVAHCGSPEEVFREKKSALLKIPGVRESSAAVVTRQQIFRQAEQELDFADQNNIELLFYLDASYPERLRHCYDSPILLYHLGNTKFENPRVLSIIGTRKSTEYGRQRCEALLADLAPYNVLIVSGLAYGIDICAHKAALENGLQTVGVLGHGLDRIYPQMHRATAKKMIEQGGLLSEFTSGTSPDQENFPKRNRIVAGLADATVVIESGVGGGSLITAEIANSYGREVLAFPGRVEDPFSAGCNRLIKQNKAALVENAEDIIRFMGWEQAQEKKKVVPLSSFTPSNDEQRLLDMLRDQGNVNLDDICFASGYASGKAAALLLNLELAGLVKSLPGKMYRLN